MFDSFYIVPKLNSENDSYVCMVVDIVEKAAESVGCRRIARNGHISWDTLVIAIGGDGTMLHAMNLANHSNAVVMGINLGKIGFLTDFVVDEMLFDRMQKIIRDSNPENKYEERMSIRSRSTSYPDNPWTTVAFNEYTISNELSDTIITYDLHIGHYFAGTHRSSSLIISTPSGSTAYSLSAGGALVLPNMDVMQIVPVAALSMTSRPIIVPASQEIRVNVSTTGTVCLKADGQIVEKSEKQAQYRFNWNRRTKILHSDGYSFFNMLTQKLGWKQQ